MASNGPAIFSEESIFKYEAVVVCSVVRDRSHLCASEGSSGDAVLFLLESFEAAGLKVQVLEGREHKVFIKVRKLSLAAAVFILNFAHFCWRIFMFVNLCGAAHNL